MVDLGCDFGIFVSTKKSKDKTNKDTQNDETK